MADSLLVNLSSYKQTEKRSATENFVTEALCYLLRCSLRKHTSLFSDFMQMYSARASREEYECYSISTQKAYITADGRIAIPDITLIKESAECFFVEVKVESGINYYAVSEHQVIDQLENYARIITPLPRRIWLLSKYAYEAGTGVCIRRRWYEVSNLLGRYSSSDPVEEFLVANLVAYLKEERMSLPRVGYELLKGMEALDSLFQQLELALEGYSSEKSFTYNWLGYYIKDKKGRKAAWIGTLYEGDRVTMTVEDEGLKKRLLGRAQKEFDLKDSDGNTWVHSVLSFEESGFFCLKADQQLDVLRKWIRQKMDFLEA